MFSSLGYLFVTEVPTDGTVVATTMKRTCTRLAKPIDATCTEPSTMNVT